MNAGPERVQPLERRLVLASNMETPTPLTVRQQEVADCVKRYVDAAHELPSTGWISRRLNISRERARQHMEALRDKGWFSPSANSR